MRWPKERRAFLRLGWSLAVAIACALALVIDVLTPFRPQLADIESKIRVVALSLVAISFGVLGHWPEEYRRGFAGLLRSLLLILCIVAIGLTLVSLTDRIGAPDLILGPILLLMAALTLWQLTFSLSRRPPSKT
ncbi:MAG: hypothetical protein U0841_22595 [Chloroflexia bacterium]